MAALPDGTAIGEVTFNDEPSKSVAKTSTGLSRYALALVSWFGSTGTITSVTYGGSPMTELVTLRDGGPADVGVAIYGFPNPPTGSTTVQVNFSANSYGAIKVVTINGADSSQPVDVDSVQGVASELPSLTLTAANDDLIVDALHFGDTNTNSVGADQVELGTVLHGGFSASLQASYQLGSVSGDQVAWTGPSSTWAYAAVTVRAATGGQESTDPPFQTTVHVRRLG